MKLLSSLALRIGWLLFIPSAVPFSSNSQDLCNPRPSVSLTLTFLDDSIMKAIDNDASDAQVLAVKNKMNEVYPWLSSLMGNTCILQIFGFDESTFYHDYKKTTSIPGGTAVEGEWEDAYERGIQLVGPFEEFHEGKGFEIETNCTESVEFFSIYLTKTLSEERAREIFKYRKPRSEWKWNVTNTWSIYDLMTITFLTRTNVMGTVGVGEWKLNDFSRTDLLAARIPSELFDHYTSRFIKFPGIRKTNIFFDEIGWEESYLLYHDTAVLPYPRRNLSWKVYLNLGIEGIASGRVDLKARPEAIEIDPGASECSDKLDIPEPILPSTSLCTVNEPSLRLKIKFIEKPNDRTLSFRYGVDKTEVVDELSNTFPELFELFNKTCILELRNLNETYWSSVSMRQTKRDAAVFSRTLRQIYSHSPYDMDVICDDGVGEAYFKSFVQRRIVVIPPEGADIDSCNVPPQRPFTGPSHVGITTGSTYSNVDLDILEGGTYLSDGLRIDFSLVSGGIYGFGSNPSGCLFDFKEEDFLPDWLSIGTYYSFSTDKSSRDEDLKYYNAFPFGENHLYTSEDTDFRHNMIFQAKLYKHPAIDSLNSNVMKMWAQVEEIELIPAEKCLTSFSDRTFYIKNQETGLCLSSKVDDKDIKFELATCDSTRSNQQWYYDENNHFKLRNEDDRCLQYMGNALFLGSCTQKSRYFEFELVKVESGDYQIMAFDKKQRVHYVGCKNPGVEEDEKIKLYHDGKKKVTYDWVLEFI